MSLTIYTDGGARGNPGEAAVGITVLKNGQVVFEQAAYIGTATNNEAEYQAILSALEWLEAQEDRFSAETEVTFKLDSKLVVEQLKENWKIKESRLKKYANQCWEILDSLPYSVELTHVTRAENEAADALVNQALDARK